MTENSMKRNLTMRSVKMIQQETCFVYKAAKFCSCCCVSVFEFLVKKCVILNNYKVSKSMIILELKRSIEIGKCSYFDNNSCINNIFLYVQTMYVCIVLEFVSCLI